METITYGKHLILDCYNANPEKLKNISFIFKFLDSLPGKIGMKKIGPPQIANFENSNIAGVTGIVMIVTSHISIHTYVNQQCFFMDIFSCKDFDSQKVTNYIQKKFNVKKIEKIVISRGKEFPLISPLCISPHLPPL